MLELKCVVDVDKLKKNYKINKKVAPYIQSYKRIKPRPNKRALVIAAGPSLDKSIEQIKKYDADIFACKSAKYLMQKGVIPKFSVHTDPQEQESKYIFKDKNLIHFVSSQCDPILFEKLKGERVYQMNIRSSADWMPPNIVTQGSSVTVSAIILAVWLGYKTIDIFGWDCSYTKNTHVGDREEGQLKPTMEIDVDLGNGQIVHTKPAMIGQAQEAIGVLSHYTSNGIDIGIHGDGLLPYLLLDAKRREAAGERWNPFDKKIEEDDSELYGFNERNVT